MRIVTDMSSPAFPAALLFVTLVAASAAASGALIPGYRDDITAYDSREVSMLPPYCRYTQSFRDRVPGGNNRSEIERWRVTMGLRGDSRGAAEKEPIFEAMHHYCWALMKTNRAMLLARSKQIKDFYLGDSINDLNYVIERAPQSFVLLPEILTKKGENLIRLDKASAGIVELQHAIELKPDYWPPYAAMSDYYKRAGNTAKARELLEKALSFSPDSKGLKRRLAELNGAKGKSKVAP